MPYCFSPGCNHVSRIETCRFFRFPANKQVFGKNGKLSAVVSWGEPTNPPILMVHGFMDSLATFVPIVDQLPDDFYYVGVDLPGNGKSDAFPGLTLNHAHMVEVIRRVVLHLRWDTFVYMSHSLGFMIGVYYNAAFPGKISKMINFDPVPLLSAFYHSTFYLDLWLNFFYTDCHENYKKFQSKSSKSYTYEQAIDLIAKVRRLDKSQARIVVSRTLVSAGKDRYRFDQDEKCKRIAGLLIDIDGIQKILLTNTPIMLNICTKNPSFPAFINKEMEKSADIAKKIEENLRSNSRNVTAVVVDAHHDLHITNAAEMAPHVSRFLNTEFRPTAKL